MIIASRSPPGERNHGTEPSIVPGNGIVNEQSARFTLMNTNAPGIYPKRMFTDDSSVENQPTTRFRLPPRYRNVQNDDGDDALTAKERPNKKATTDRASSSIAESRNENRHFQDAMINPENSTNTAHYHHNLTQRDVGQMPTLTSWTAATGTSEQGHPTAWRRHYLDDTRRIQTAPLGQDISVYADTRTNSQIQDRVSSFPVRHEVLLSDMRSIYTIGVSQPESMATFQQQALHGIRNMPSLEMAHNRTIQPNTNVLYASRNMEVPTNMKSTHTSRYTLPESSNHNDRQVTASFNVSQNYVHERFRWRHPNGRMHQQIQMGVPPPTTNRDIESHLPTNFHHRVVHPNLSNSHRQLHFMAKPSDSNNINSDQTHVLSSDRTNQVHHGATTFERMVSHDQHLRQERQYQKNQQPRPPPNAPPATQPPPPVFEKVKGFDKLDLLCTATLEVGELHDNPTGCSCPKSKCVALYCDCFKAGRRCHPNRCSCFDCKNTIAESGIDGARTKAIRNILARNPRAFNTAGMGNPLHKLPPGEVACNCVRSKCLKLYCSCFHHGKLCRPDICTCVGCENIVSTDDSCNGNREAAIQHVMEKRADAFVIKPKVIGQGCACKNNKCLRKYCECYRTGLRCNPNKCTCRDCENRITDSTNYPTADKSKHNGSPPVLLSEVSQNVSV